MRERATVKAGSDQLTLTRAKETQLAGALIAEKFDPKVGDELVRWSSRRSGYLAMANVTAAKTMSQDTGQWNGYMGSGYGWGGWAFNPLFGMYTYVPFGGIGFSPFGYGYYSPYSAFYSPFGYGGFGYYPVGYYPGGYYGGGGTVASGSTPSTRTPVYNRAPGRLSNGGRAGGGFGSSSGYGPARAGTGSIGSTSNSLGSFSRSTSSSGFGGGHSAGGGGGHR